MLNKFKDIILVNFKKDTPQSELLFNMVLYHSTSPSGQSKRCQKNESTAIEVISITMAVGTAIFKILKIC